MLFFRTCLQRRHIILSAIVLASILSIVPQETTFAAPQSYYVATNGSDSNPGTLSQPFKTIQKCASKAIAGDSCLIRAGTYRETIRPGASGSSGAPIIFAAYNGEQVTISGADPISGWAQDAGSIYKAAMPWSMNVRSSSPYQITNNQIFVDGQMMVEARWPNIPVAKATRFSTNDGARSDSAVVSSASSASYNDSDLSGFATDAWKGAKINFAPGWGTITTSCDVTGSNASSVSFSCNPDPGAQNKQTTWSTDPNNTLYRPTGGNFYYLWGKRAALDTAGEWFREGAADAGQLYLWAPDGANPGNRVEARRRLWAFDIGDRAYITIRDLKLFAAGIKANLNTNNTLIERIEARYTWHFQELPPLYQSLGTYGIEFQGNNNTIRDSLLAHSAGPMLSFRGPGNSSSSNRVVNNVIASASYMGNAPAIVGASPGGSQSHEVSQNTIYNTGRYALHAESGMNITFNDIFNSHLQTRDLGAIYGYGTDGKGANIGYNLVHDISAEYNPSKNYFGGYGIYLDDDTYNYNVYRNITWNTSSSGIFLFGTNGTVVKPNVAADTPSNRRVYNNSVDGLLETRTKANKNGKPQVLNGVEVRNNIAGSAKLVGAGLVSGNNIVGSGGYVDQAARDYRLRSDSPARGAGATLSYADASKDAGALPFGQAPFVAGALIRPSDLAGLDISCARDAGGSTATCSVRNLPQGRKLPNTFQLRVGSAAAGQNCLTRIDYSTIVGQATCAGVPLNSSSSGQAISMQLSGGGWQGTGRTLP